MKFGRRVAAIRLAAILVQACALAAAAPLAPAAAIAPIKSAGKAKRAALLVAIADYPDEIAEVWSDLEGPEHDLALMQELLTGRFGFQPEEIRTLVNEQATHEAIVREFHEWLIERADAATEVFFWYGGHGSRIPDESGGVRLEQEDLDSTLLAWDSRLDGRDGSFDISDDELASLLLALTERTGRVTLITDSCHSGGVSRGGAAGRVRAFKDGTRAHEFERIRGFWPQSIPFYDDHERRADPSRYVHISACGPHQLALEWCFPNGGDSTCYGALSLFLADRMRRATPGDTYRQVVGDVERWVAARLPSQAVQYEGALDRELFGADFKPPPQGFRAHHRAGTRAEVVIAAGSLHGLCRGARLQATDLKGAVVGELEVMKVRPISSVAAWKGAPPEWLADLAMLATEISRPGGREPLRVQAADPALRALLAAEFPDEVDLAGQGEGTHRLERIAEAAGSRFRFVDAEGVRIWPGPKDDVPQADWQGYLRGALGEVLETERRYQAVMALAREKGDVAFKAQFAALDPKDLEGPDYGQGRARGTWKTGRRLVDARVAPIRGGLSERSGGRTFLSLLPAADPVRVGCLARLDVTNDSAADLYPAVLSVSEDRQITLIHPAEYEPLRPLPPGATRKVYVELLVNEKLDLDRPMLDRYLVIATPAPADFRPWVQGSALRSAATESSAIPPIIESALAGRVTRSGSVPAERGGYGVATLDVLVGRAVETP